MGKKFTISYQTVEEYNKEIEQKYQERIAYYLRESITPTLVDENKTYTRKDKRKYKKWLKQKRKERIADAKEWGPWDSSYLYLPLKQTLFDMF